MARLVFESRLVHLLRAHDVLGALFLAALLASRPPRRARRLVGLLCYRSRVSVVVAGIFASRRLETLLPSVWRSAP